MAAKAPVKVEISSVRAKYACFHEDSDSAFASNSISADTPSASEAPRSIGSEDHREDLEEEEPHRDPVIDRIVPESSDIESEPSLGLEMLRLAHMPLEAPLGSDPFATHVIQIVQEFPDQL